MFVLWYLKYFFNGLYIWFILIFCIEIYAMLCINWNFLIYYGASGALTADIITDDTSFKRKINSFKSYFLENLLNFRYLKILFSRRCFWSWCSLRDWQQIQSRQHFSSSSSTWSISQFQHLKKILCQIETIISENFLSRITW